MSDIKHTTVDVSVQEMFDFGHEYEYFVDLLRDKISEVVNMDDESGSFFDMMVHSYAAVAIAEPNVIKFDVEWYTEV